jgi:coenzyme F420 hydrogenase subunit beta
MTEKLADESAVNKPHTASSVAEIVANGLCIGCGLCEAVTCGNVKMKMTGYGSLRPTPVDAFSADEEKHILSACPGVIVEHRPNDAPFSDTVWGSFRTMRYAWAGNLTHRFIGSTGGVLTALGSYLLDSGQVKFVLHVGPDPERPMRNRWVHSETPEDILANAGSRYGPVSPLAGLGQALDRNEPFAIIAKPCDFNALHQAEIFDPRIAELCIARLAMVCGGQSRLTKSQALLSELDIEEPDVSLFRYRGYGNPGSTRVETKSGGVFELSYHHMWENESGWDIENRCKVCPDALGDACDVVAADVWPGCNPAGEDEGFNGVIVRTAVGEALVSAAAEAGALVLGDAISPRMFDSFQPHQIRKKTMLNARFEGLRQAGKPVIKTVGLYLDELAEAASPQELLDEAAGTFERAKNGRFDEPAIGSQR